MWLSAIFRKVVYIISKHLACDRDIKVAFSYYPKSGLWLINVHNGIKGRGVPRINIEDYPAVKEHLIRLHCDFHISGDVLAGPDDLIQHTKWKCTRTNRRVPYFEVFHTNTHEKPRMNTL